MITAFEVIVHTHDDGKESRRGVDRDVIFSPG